MSLIDPSYFIAEISIAQRGYQEVNEDLLNVISKYENDLLVKFFGRKMANEMLANPELPKWKEIIQGNDYWMGLINPLKMSPIANYVYYYFTRKEVIKNTGTGMVRPKNENSTPESPVYKQVRAWNEMVVWLCELHKYIVSDLTLYPDYKWKYISDPCCNSFCYCNCGCGDKYPFVKINSLGL